MIVVDCLYEWLDLATLGLPGFGHATGDGGRVALDATDEGVGEWMGFGSGVEGLDDDDLEQNLLA